MKTLELNHERGCCTVHCGRDLIGDGESWAGAITGRVLIVTDRTVAGLYLSSTEAALAAHAPKTLILPAGETAKTIDNWRKVLKTLADIGARRDATVVALGGGVIGDLAGFAAASYMRGIRVVQVPTTLLAQVDAAVGGKTGVNLSAGKNLVGAFHQPHRVIADVATLATLEARDYSAGLAEVVKYAAIGDAGFLDWLERHAARLMDRDAEMLEQAIATAIAHKIAVVEADEREAGQRALLNFGHTFGHAIETVTGYTRYRHGEAVAIGMCLAAKLSARIGNIAAEDAGRLAGLLARLDLPTRRPADIDPDQLLDRMQLDKKNRTDQLRLVLLDRIGRASVRDDIDENDLRSILKA